MSRATYFTTAFIFALSVVIASATASGSMLSAVVIDAPSSSIRVNGTVQLTASTLDENGSAFAAETTWASSSTAIAAVNSTGLVTGVATGGAGITASASAGGVTVSTTIAINVMPQWAGAPPPTNVLVNDASKASVPNIAQKEPSIAVFGAHVVVGWNDWAIELGRTLRGVRNGVGYGFSSDGGATFTDAGEVGTSHWGADPTVAVDRSGNFYFSRFDLQPGSATLDRIAVFKSTDGGATFPESANANDNAESPGNDAPMIAVGTTASPFSGTVYAIWGFQGVNPRFTRSTDGGASFSSPIQPLTHGPLAIGPNGEVYVVGMDASGLLVTKSTDGGLSFGPTIRVASANPLGQTESATAQYCGNVLKGSLGARIDPRIAVDRSGGPDNGTVYVVFGSHGAGADGADVYLTRSTDGGATWSTPSRLNDDATANDQWLPFVAVAPNGSVAVSWYDRRLDDQNLLIDLFMRISTDGGASFGPNLKITEVSFPPPGIDRTLGFPPYSCYFSSYNWIVADAANFYLVWTDNRRVRSSTIDPNIFFAKVPVPGGPNYQGLWWAAPGGSEAGWGINFAHQGDTIFASWFTYDLTGKGTWLVMAATKTAPNTYTGTLLQGTGPAFDAVPFPPLGSPGGATVSGLGGTGTITFSDANDATFAYTLGGISQTKAITRELIGPQPTCVFGALADLRLATNYTDLWWAAPAGSEAGWGINLTHQGDTIFATWYTFDVDHTPMWLVVTATKTAPGVYAGTPVYRLTGPPFNTVPFAPLGSPGGATGLGVGSASFAFSDGNTAMFSYTVNGVTQSKTITREVFTAPGTVCQ